MTSLTRGQLTHDTGQLLGIRELPVDSGGGYSPPTSAANPHCTHKLIATMEAEPLDDASLVATATAVDDSSPPKPPY